MKLSNATGQRCNEWLDSTGLSKEQAVNFAGRMGFSPGCRDQAGEWMLRLYDLFIERDATLIEINPMTEDLLGRGQYV